MRRSDEPKSHAAAAIVACKRSHGRRASWSVAHTPVSAGARGLDRALRSQVQEGVRCASIPLAAHTSHRAIYSAASRHRPSGCQSRISHWMEQSTWSTFSRSWGWKPEPPPRSPAAYITRNESCQAYRRHRHFPHAIVCAGHQANTFSGRGESPHRR